MGDIWYSSDLHFSHSRVLEFGRKTRRGDNIEEMNELLLESLNSKVKDNDDFYIIGDFSFGNATKIEEVLKRLNGKLHLIAGNHDKVILKNPHLQKYFEEIVDYKRIVFEKVLTLMMHFPIVEWENAHRGGVHLHGHLHGKGIRAFPELHQKYRIFDVGIDNRPDNLMLPWHWEEIKEILKDREDFPH